MLIGENILLAFNGLRANKMRSLLTMLGIIIGIASVIAIMTLGDSISSSVTESMSSMGANNVTIGVSQKSTTEETTASGMTFSAGPRFTQMSEDDYISEEMLDDLQERYTDSIQGGICGKRNCPVRKQYGLYQCDRCQCRQSGKCRPDTSGRKNTDQSGSGRGKKSDSGI